MIKLYRCNILCREDAHALILQAAKELCGAEDPKVLRTAAGKPYFADLPIFFSLSHSGERAILAVSDREIGADIQEKRAVNLRLAARFFTARENEYIGEDVDRFFEIWTKKEAYGKWQGVGLGTALQTDILEKKFYTETDGQYVIAVYEE